MKKEKSGKLINDRTQSFGVNLVDYILLLPVFVLSTLVLFKSRPYIGVFLTGSLYLFIVFARTTNRKNWLEEILKYYFIREIEGGEYSRMKFSRIKTTKNNNVYFCDGKGNFGIVFEVSPLDIEQGETGESVCYSALSSLFDSIPEGILVKSHYKSTASFDPLEGVSRSEMLEDGHRKIQLYLSLTIRSNFLKTLKGGVNAKNALDEKIDSLVKKLSFGEIEAAGGGVNNIDPLCCPFFDEKIELKNCDGFLLKDNKFLSIIKLESLSGGDENNEVYYQTLPYILRDLPLNAEMTTSFIKLNRAVSEGDLRIQTNRKHLPANRGEADKLDAKEEVLKQVELYGQTIAKLDVNFVLTSESLDHLNQVSEELLSTVGHLGVFKRQLKTCLDPYLSTRVNHKTSSMQKERGPVIPFFIPFCHFSRKEKDHTKDNIAFLRDDFSPFLFNPFNMEYYARNGLIIGNTGRGKSVFLNLMIDSLVKRQENIVLLIDVKTSHTALAKKHDGQIHEIDIDSATGMSAFNLLGLGKDRYIKEHVVDFTTSLAEGGDKLKDLERSKISTIVNQYLSENNPEFSLNGFISYARDKHLPNFSNVERWGEDGIYGEVFKGNNSSTKTFQYFDLKSINAAGKVHITKAVIASVMSQIYLLLRTKKKSERLFVIFDETPFFINDSFGSLAALAKNIRSMNGSVVFTSQVSSDLIGPNKEETLFSQSNYKILFTSDGEKEEYIRRTGITEGGFETLKSFKKPIGRQTRRFLLKDDLGERAVGIRLTDEEYYRATTDPKDKEVLESVKNLFKVNEVSARKIMEFSNGV